LSRVFHHFGRNATRRDRPLLPTKSGYGKVWFGWERTRGVELSRARTYQAPS
jgi:hypothetical protein